MIPLSLALHSSPAPWTARFNETGGYDCMTGAWEIFDVNGRQILTIDQRDYGQDNCEFAFRSERAEADAKLIVHLRNSLE